MKDEIVRVKRIRVPLFEEDDLDGTDKYLIPVAKKILAAADKIKVDYLFVAKLFLKMSFPLSGQHTAIRSIGFAWKKFKEQYFDEECVALGAFFSQVEDFSKVDDQLRVFFKNWNSIAESLRDAYQKNQSPLFLEKAYALDFYSYKVALKLFFYVRPVVLTGSSLGDIFTEKTSLYNFVQMCHLAGRLRPGSVTLGAFVKKDPTSTRFFVESVVQEYIAKYKKDPTMRTKQMQTQYNVTERKKDSAAINKLKNPNS